MKKTGLLFEEEYMNYPDDEVQYGATDLEFNLFGAFEDARESPERGPSRNIFFEQALDKRLPESTNSSEFFDFAQSEKKIEGYFWTSNTCSVRSQSPSKDSTSKPMCDPNIRPSPLPESIFYSNLLRPSPLLETLVNKVMKGKAISPREEEELSEVDSDLFEAIKQMIDSASKRPDSLIRAALSTVKKYLVKNKRKMREYKSTNSNYYRKSKEVFNAILKDMCPRLSSKDLERLDSVWNYKSGLTDTWYSNITLDRKNYYIVDHITGLMRVEGEENKILQTYLAEKSSKAVSSLLRDENNKYEYATREEILERLVPCEIQRKDNKVINQQRIKFPLTKPQFVDALQKAIERLESLDPR